MGMVKNSQSYLNSNFALSLKCLKQEVSDNVDFLNADKHQSYLQVDFNTMGIARRYKVIITLLMSMIKHSQSTQSNKFAISLRYFKKEVSDRVYFWMQSNIKTFTTWIIVIDESIQTRKKYPKQEARKIFAVY